MASAHDTLDHVNTDGAKTIADVYKLILGKAMEAEDLCGVVCTGPLNQSLSQSGDWGRHPLTFDGHPEVWHVRCAPPGRMGEPLMPYEVRRIAVLMRESKDSKDSIVTTIKLWRLAGSTEKLTRASKDKRQRERGRCTFGPIGVSTHGINIFEQRATPSSTFPTTDGTQTVLSGIVSVTADDAPAARIKIEHQVAASYMLAAALVGARLPQSAISWNCQERYTEKAWQAFCDASVSEFKRTCCEMNVDSVEGVFKAIMAAEDVLEQTSFIGYLDKRADAFFVGALPDDMHKPSGLPLMLVIAVCVACNPKRWGMNPPSTDDLFATKEAGLFIESVLPTILSVETEGVACSISEDLHSFDVVINYGIDKVREVIAMLKSGKYETKKGNVGYRWPEMALEDTMKYLQCTGIAVCVDLFGLRPNPPTEGPLADAYTPYGLATAVLDPIMASREQSAHEFGLGNIFPRWETLRTSTRGRRQLALASAFVEVDTWLRTGKYKDAVLRPTTEASVSVPQEELDPTAKPEAQAPAPTVAATTAAKSAKKKKRPEALLAERSRMRGAKQQYCAKEAVRAIMHYCGTKDEKYIAAASNELCDHAIASATGIFSDILQHGACVGMADLFNFTTYLVSPSSKVPCAHCENEVNVVESIAFSGAYGRCSACRHPRCLQCVSKDINAQDKYTIYTCPEHFKTCRFCKPQA